MKFNTTKLFTLLVAIAHQANGKGYECGKHIVVQEGEECSTYLHSSTLPYVREKDFYFFNPTVDCSQLTTGTKLCLEVDFDKYYENISSVTIRKKDTLQYLAKKLKTSEEILRRVNVPIFNAYKDFERLVKLEGQDVYYRKDGDYVPDFSNSEDVSIRSSNTVKRSENGYKCNQHAVVPQGGKCTDFTNKFDIPYVRMKDLTNFNPTVDCDHLSAGTKLCLEPDYDDIKNFYTEYTTKKGDTLKSVAKKLNVDPVILKKINQPIFDVDGKKKAGIKIRYSKNGVYVPDFSNSKQVNAVESNDNGKGYKCDYHVVASEGSKCTDFTNKFDIPYVRMKDITSYNPTVDCDHLSAGTKLCIDPNDDDYINNYFADYTTKKGDTLVSIAEKLNVDPVILKIVNQPIFDIDGKKKAGIQIRYSKSGVYVPDFSSSEEIKVAKSNESNESGSGYKCNKHVVVSEGSQCTDYAHKTDIPYVRMKDLLAFNPTVDCDHLATGTKLCLEPSDDSSSFSKYTIKKGDTYDSIAKELNTDKKILKNINQPLFNYDDETQTLEKKVGLELEYSKTGSYVPDFSKSEEVKSSN